MTDISQRITQIIEPTITHMGYELVRVSLIGTAKRQTLQIMAERTDRAAMTVDDCEAISREISAVMDVEDPITERYNLEVSSPGIDRPLTRLNDFDRFKGHLATIDLKVAVDQGEGKPARKRFQGVLTGIEGVNVKLNTGTQKEPVETSLAFDDIAKAKLVLTDELIKAGISN